MSSAIQVTEPLLLPTANQQKMRNLVIDEILKMMQIVPITYNIKPWDQWSNRELLEFYGNLRIDIETEEYDDDEY